MATTISMQKRLDEILISSPAQLRVYATGDGIFYADLVVAAGEWKVLAQGKGESRSMAIARLERAIKEQEQATI